MSENSCGPGFGFQPSAVVVGGGVVNSMMGLCPFLPASVDVQRRVHPVMLDLSHDS